MRKRYYSKKELNKAINELYNLNGSQQEIDVLAKAHHLMQYIDYLKAVNWNLNLDWVLVDMEYSAKGVLKFSYEISFKINMRRYSFKMKGQEGIDKVHDEIMKKVELSNHKAYHKLVETEDRKIRNKIRKERLAQEA